MSYLSSNRRQVDTLDDLAGLAGSYPKTAGAIALFMFSLTGCRRLAGFWGKLMLFTGALGVDSPGSAGEPLALVPGAGDHRRRQRGHLGGLLSAGRRRDVLPPRDRPARCPWRLGPAWAMAVCAAGVVGIGCFPGAAIEHATRASQSRPHDLRSIALASGRFAGRLDRCRQPFECRRIAGGGSNALTAASTPG